MHTRIYFTRTRSQRAGTLVPALKGVRDEAFGPLSPEAELQNGRAAMLGFAMMLLMEVGTGRAFF